MKLFRFEGYKVSVEPEALMLSPFRKLWDRDASPTKDKALRELAFVYFCCDPASDYQYVTDREERMASVKESEGFPKQWKPDKEVLAAMAFYEGFKSSAALLLEDTRSLVGKFRERLRGMDFSCMDVKEMKDMGALIKQVPSMIEDLDKAEKAVAREQAQGGRARGSAEKTLMEDDLGI